MLKTRDLLVLALLLLPGCSIAPPKQTAEIHVDKSAEATTQLLLDQAEKCWKRAQSVLADGVEVRAYPSATTKHTFTLTAARFASDLRDQKPALEVTISPAGKNESTVKVQEGDWACNLLARCRPMGFTQDLRRWLRGDLSCTPLPQ
jgi:hypothetical protein